MRFSRGNRHHRALAGWGVLQRADLARILRYMILFVHCSNSRPRFVLSFIWQPISRIILVNKNVSDRELNLVLKNSGLEKHAKAWKSSLLFCKQWPWTSMRKAFACFKSSFAKKSSGLSVFSMNESGDYIMGSMSSSKWVCSVWSWRWVIPRVYAAGASLTRCPETKLMLLFFTFIFSNVI